MVRSIRCIRYFLRVTWILELLLMKMKLLDIYLNFTCLILVHTVDHVSIPSFVEKLRYWVLEIYITKDRVIHVYDSMRGVVHDRKILGAIESYAVLVPHQSSLVSYGVLYE